MTRAVSVRRDDVLVAAAALLPLALFLLREHRIAGGAGFPLDDSWIHLHFARNLAEGAGFSFNPGRPVAGSTAPLWTLLLALGVKAFGASVLVVKAIGVAGTLAAGIVTRRAAAAWGAPDPLALAAGVGLVWAGPMVWGAFSGMEVPLAALLVAAALLAHARGSAGWTATWGALASVARPEALLLVPLLALARPLTRRRLAAFGLVTVVVLAPMVAFTLATVGAPLPATAAAKIEGGLIGWLAGLHEPLARTFLSRPWEFLAEWIGWLTRTHWLLPPLALLAMVLAWRRPGAALGIPALALVVHPLGMALLAPYRGPAFQEGRYSAHLLPLAMIVIAAAIGAGSHLSQATHDWHWPRGTRYNSGLRKKRPGFGLPGFPARVAVPLFFSLYFLLGLATVPAAATRYAWGVQNINAMQVHLGRWVDAHLPKNARLAVNDIGAIAYFSRREVIDLMGLVTPDIIPYRRRGEAGVIEYVRAACPDYVIIFPAWFPAMAARADLLEPIYGVRLDRNEVAGAAEMVVYRLARCTV